MATRQAFLRHLWTNRINSYTQEDWIDKEVQLAANNPTGPFADIGPIIARLLAIGATTRELSLLARMAEYNGIFDALYALDNHPGIDDGRLAGLADELLMADPSGLEGRPGSAPNRMKA